MYSTAYSNMVEQTQPLNYTTDLSFLGKIVDVKTQLYDVAYNYINSLKSNAINLRFENKHLRERVGKYNEEIDNFFKSTDLSKIDLSDYSVANNITKIFDGLTQDTAIISNYKRDKDFAETREFYEAARKNPAKFNFSEDNYIVWLYENYKPYVEDADIQNLHSHANAGYLSKYNWQKELDNIKNLVKADVDKVQIPELDSNGKPTGAMLTIDKQGITSEKFQQFFANYLSSDAKRQIANESKAGFYKTFTVMTPQEQEKFRADLYTRSKNQFDVLRKKHTEISQFIAGQISVATTDERKAELLKEKQKHDAEIARYVFSYSPEDYKNASVGSLANFYASSGVANKISHLANSMSYQLKSTMRQLDPVYEFFANYNNDVRALDIQQFKVEQEAKLAQEELDLKKQIAENKVDGNSASGGRNIGTEAGNIGINASGLETIDTLESKINGFKSQIDMLNNTTVTEGDLFAIKELNQTSPRLEIIKQLAHLHNIDLSKRDNESLGKLSELFNKDTKRIGQISEINKQFNFFNEIKNIAYNKFKVEMGVPINTDFYPKNNDEKLAFNRLLSETLKSFGVKTTKVYEEYYGEIVAPLIAQSLRGTSINAQSVRTPDPSTIALAYITPQLDGTGILSVTFKDNRRDVDKKSGINSGQTFDYIIDSETMKKYKLNIDFDERMYLQTGTATLDIDNFTVKVVREGTSSSFTVYDPQNNVVKDSNGNTRFTVKTDKIETIKSYVAGIIRKTSSKQ